MTGAAVFNQALRELRGLELAAEAERDLVAALRAAAPGPCDLFYALAHEVSPSRDELLARCSGLFCAFAAGNLADDLIDGDCDYLSRPSAIGPSVQFGLQHLAYSILLRSDVPATTTSNMARDLATGGGAEHHEHGHDGWSMKRFVLVAEGIAGLQWRAYLPVLWAGGGRENASGLGRALGLALHLAEDIRTEDTRFVSLPEADRREVARWGAALATELRASRSPCLENVASSLESIWQGVLS
jgi:hypothetical protein